MADIEKDVPIPKTASGAKYTFADLDIGDSMFLATAVEYVRARSASYAYASRHPEFRFTARFEGEGGRIWRVEE